jgi:hypothetical protein
MFECMHPTSSEPVYGYITNKGSQTHVVGIGKQRHYELPFKYYGLMQLAYISDSFVGSCTLQVSSQESITTTIQYVKTKLTKNISSQKNIKRLFFKLAIGTMNIVRALSETKLASPWRGKLSNIMNATPLNPSMTNSMDGHGNLLDMHCHL